MSDNSDPNTSTTVIVGVVGAIVVFALIVALQALYYHVEETRIQAQTANEAPDAIVRLRAEQSEVVQVAVAVRAAFGRAEGPALRRRRGSRGAEGQGESGEGVESKHRESA